MTEVVNLNKARKARTRAEDKARADENAAKFGRTKAQRALEDQQAAKAKAALDAVRRDND
ncbi:DUF4169 family protein [Ketogulonicigenium vulgare]|uniref:Uncharacterized protein n=1 Tax=Ketogulonicigenium vulgare (strain WSH-001) TaxID=759362 RepID=F9Y6U0_KETVW|nr:DUF4169 family protein [Ketogulonicigenium vulgare]ADO42771.1 conserved hypothetical protein [Ketogulonicigenium vulgare Y25]AEM40957.1 hypothetical protein KVU_1118 [Ketogulonicigenium vulgare WSH-001]ALJ81106.1 amidase [Ketogulonicigenium vulgare]ANW35047.1 DUF4169 domain-containing protein [Ketogulonicigenium vulgare]AOZ54682.1 hypothetical protein KVC_1669 [Ketogulonicigenium vulgare]